MPGVAVKHAIESGSAEASARTINQQAEGAFHLGYHTLLGSWLESLSEEFIRTNFELAVYKAWILFLTGKISALRLFLDRIEPDAGRIKDTESYRRYLSLKAWVARSEGDANVVIEMPLLLDSEGRENPTVKLISHLSVARAAYQAGRTDEAVSVLREAYRLERESGNAFAALCALHTLCFYLLDVGQREEIQSLCTEALEIFTDSQGSKLPISGMAYLPLAVSRYEANALDDAKNYSEIGLSLCRNLNLEDILVEDGTRTLARVHLARGRVENAVSLLNDTLKRYETSNLYAPISSLQALRAELAIRRGDIETAMIWAEPRAFDALSPPTGLPGYEHIVFVRLLLARGNLDNASKWLLVMKNGCVQAQRNRMLLTLLLLEVIWCILSEKTADAVRITEQALMIASPQNYRRPFIDELPTIESVVLQCRPIAPDFVESLRVDGTVLSTRSLTAPVSESILDESAAIEPLTRREQEVLKLAAEALANREIADRLFISVGTVKWHMNHILAKLNVPSRSKAVARAKELGLL
ncbi:MAG: tetratricopeptide repeat protein [Spirochaetaceae bacterium]|nr:MAG: tetratricopeptide repeat protein [Spirochaetaceae bacterium]